MSTKVRNIVEWIWQLPQNICGIVWKNIHKKNIISKVDNPLVRELGGEIYLMRNSSETVLGKYIFIKQDYKNKTNNIIEACEFINLSKTFGPMYFAVLVSTFILYISIESILGHKRDT